MNRLKRIGGSIVLAAALMASSIGVSPASAPAVAAESAITAEQFGQYMSQVGAKIKEIASTQTLKTCVSGSATIMGGTTPFEMDMSVDATSKVGYGKMPNFQALSDQSAMIDAMTKGIPSVEMYMDLSKDLMYIHPEGTNLNFVNAFPSTSYLQGFGVGQQEGNMFTSMFTPELLKLFEGHLTVTKDDTTLNGVPVTKLSLKINYAKGEIAALVEGMMKNLPAGFKDMGAMMGGSNMGGFDMGSMMKDMMKDLAVSGTDDMYALADGTPVKMESSLEVEGIKFGDVDLGKITANINIGFEASAEKLSIPEEFKKNLVITPYYPTQNSGLSLLSQIDTKGHAFFMVVEPLKSNVKKLTIPASVKSLGVTTKVEAIAPDAFKGAKKLKVLIVKNAKLKKMLKKNRKKFGLSKKVKIK